MTHARTLWTLPGLLAAAFLLTGAGPVKPATPSKTTPGAKPSAAESSAPAPEGGSSSQADLGSVDVQGEAKDKVTIDKMVPTIKIDMRDLVDSVTDKTERLLERARPVPSAEDFARFDKLDSQQTARPWLPDLAEPPLISFLPAPSATTVKGWRLEVTDAKGDVIKTLSGTGAPVKEIIWDGVADDKKIIKVDAVYSFRFITIDEFKNLHTTMGKAFTLKHLKYRDAKNLYVEIANSLMFKDEKVAPDALPILERAIDVLRENSRYPFFLEMHTDTPQGEMVRVRQRQITEKVNKDMLLPADSTRVVYVETKERGDVMRFVIRLKK
jgi:hypothetical protein